MFLAPVLDAPLAIKIHLLTVLPAAIIGALILFRRKGTRLHRMLGKVWVVLMVATAVSTFFIHTINMFHGFSPIHLLSIFVIVGCIRAVTAARRHDIRTHRNIMRGLYVGGIGIAGLFTLYPGRIMHRVVFGVPDLFQSPRRSSIGWLIGSGADFALMVAALAATGLAVVLVAAVCAHEGGFAQQRRDAALTPAGPPRRLFPAGGPCRSSALRRPAQLVGGFDGLPEEPQELARLVARSARAA